MSRRAFLASIASGAGAAGLNTLLPSPLRAEHIGRGGATVGVPSYARIPQYRTDKQSTWDRTGANDDWFHLGAGETHEIFNATGAGIITHIWITPDPETRSHLKEVVIRAYWDGSETPSIEAPLGDFFGLNLGEYMYYESAFLACAPGRSLSSYFVMPYRKSGRITVTNEGPAAISHFYASVEYQQVEAIPDDAMYFHAQYRQATPNTAQQLPGEHNLDGAANYVFCETHGRGALLGVTLGIIQTDYGWMGEGDDMTFIDDPTKPRLTGTGLEDYFNASWGFLKAFSYQNYGVPLYTPGWPKGGRSCSYRFHGDNPIAFTKYLKHTIEHGTGNNRADNYYSCCYWYQDTPSKDFPKLPALADRLMGLPPLVGRMPL